MGDNNTGDSENKMDRFQRQYIVPGFGKKAQEKLAKSKVLVIGAGGLGCPALMYLAAAGVGHIGIVDGDEVSVSNLNRQVLFGESHLGLNKAEVAAHELKTKYSDLKIEVIPEFLTTQNVWMILSKYDLVVDGSDNFPTRYLVNDACVLLRKPIVFGAVFQHQGQVGILNASGPASINYRDIYPDLPSAYEIPNCSETGVLGVLPGIIGTLQATEAIKWLTGFGNTLADKLLFYNLLDHSVYEVSLSKNPESQINRPKNRTELEDTDYAVACGDGDTVGWSEALELLENDSRSVLVDIREQDERPLLSGLPHRSLPFSRIEDDKNLIVDSELVLLFCQSGIRSLKALKILQREFPGKRIHSISGGIEAQDSPIYNR
jgi:adenylyltransferase/sulfurtransferase